MKIILIILVLIAIAQLAFLISSLIIDNYFSWLIAPLSQIASIVTGLILIFVDYRSKNTHMNQRINFVWGIVAIFLGILTTITMFLSKVYMACLWWIIGGIIHIRKFQCNRRAKTVKSIIEDDSTNRSSAQNLIEVQQQRFSFQKQKNQKESIKNKVKNCLISTICIINTILIVLFAINFCFVSYYRMSYNDIGNLITVTQKATNNQVNFNVYCSEIQNSKNPVIILQHGGGGNLIGFIPLLHELQKSKIKMCIYDRLGYGRSGKPFNTLSTQQKVHLTHELVNKIVNENESIIYGGWSAGVQLSILYQYYYPDKIKGLIFMDGYPDYLVLTAIYNNKTEVVKPPVNLIANILRILQPFGIDLFFGSNQIQNQQYRNYYKAYYRTGYLWDSQSIDLKNDQSTDWLSNIGKKQNSTLPYPNSKIYLNWPDINTNLLIMPAKNTVENDQFYGIQSDKYLQKCNGAVKNKTIIEGSHDFPTKSFSLVAKQIINFVQNITKLQ